MESGNKKAVSIPYWQMLFSVTLAIIALIYLLYITSVYTVCENHYHYMHQYKDVAIQPTLIQCVYLRLHKSNNATEEPFLLLFSHAQILIMKQLDLVTLISSLSYNKSCFPFNLDKTEQCGLNVSMRMCKCVCVFSGKGGRDIVDVGRDPKHICQQSPASVTTSCHHLNLPWETEVTRFT